MKLADRRSLIDSSGIRRIFDLAAKMQDPCNLSIGMPDFDVPDPVQEAAIHAIRTGRNAYTPTAGIPALRKKIRDRYDRWGYPHEDVLVTAGTSGALFQLFLVTLNPGDEVLFADPYFVMYKHLLRFVGAKPVPVDTYPDFRLTVERLEKAVTPRSRMLIVNSPNNPTGLVYTEEEAKALAAFAQKHDLILVSDEIYDLFAFDGPMASVAKHHPSPVVISGLSKTVAVTGWRLGWMAGPADLIKAMVEVQQYSFVCAPSMAQEAAVVAMDTDMSEQVRGYARRRDLIYAGLREAGYAVNRPQGAFYIFPEAPGGDGEKFVLRAVDKGLLIVPGNVFSDRNSHFRISFAAKEETIRRGLGILSELRAEYA